MTSSMPWVKLYTEILDDPKMGRLSDTMKWRFIQLILLAGECDAEGYFVSGHTPMTPDDIAWRLRIPDVKQLEGEMVKLKEAGVLSFDAGVMGWCVTKFSERQGRRQEEKREKWRDYQRKHRGKDDADAEQEQPPADNPPEQPSDNPPSQANVINDAGMTQEQEERRGEESKDSAAEAANNPPKPKEREPKHPERTELVKHFSGKTGIPVPRVDNKSQIKAAQLRWWTPLDAILDTTERDIDASRELITEAVNRMTRDRLTISAPASILSIVLAIYGERHRVDIPSPANTAWESH